MPANSSIIQRVFTLGGTDEAILLRGNEYTKPLALTERWTKVRLGFLWGIHGNGTSDIQNCSLNFGLCSNAPGKTWSGASSFFIGGSISSYPTTTNGGTLTYNANSGLPFYSTTTNYVYNRLNAVIGAFSYSMTSRIATVNNAPRRSLHLLDITKGSPNYTVAHISAAAINCNFNMGMNDLYDACEQINAAPVIQGTAMTVGTPTSVAFSETSTTYLNCLNIYWNRWTFPVEIYGIAVYMLY